MVKIRSFASEFNKGNVIWLHELKAKLAIRQCIYFNEDFKFIR